MTAKYCNNLVSLCSWLSC